ncbi:hypothetical protein ZWY2020_044987 [Hordeum vulgare]|nr:hypothetical protein ZWY2020_044987 [Hordeum vulgare]
MHAAPAQPLNIPCARQPAVVSSVRTGARTTYAASGPRRLPDTTRTGRQDKPPLAPAPSASAARLVYSAPCKRPEPATDGRRKATTSPSPVYSVVVRERDAPEPTRARDKTLGYAGRRRSMSSRQNARLSYAALASG